MATLRNLGASNWLFVPVLLTGALIGLVLSEELPPLRLDLSGFDRGAASRAAGANFEPSADIAIGGVPAILDGDTLEINGTLVRLHGVDAPEPGQTCGAGAGATPCGQDAALALADLIAGRVVGCARRGPEVPGRMFGVCRVGGVEINAWLVAQGWAVAEPGESAEYLPAQAEARAARRGIWQAAFVLPADWRRGDRDTLINTAVPAADAAESAAERSGESAGESAASPHAGDAPTAPPRAE